MIRNCLSRFNLLGLAAGVLAVLGAPSASAYSDGQVGLSGKVPVESCLNCHGSERSDDIVSLDFAAPTNSCYGFNSANELEELFYAVPGDTLTMTLTVAEPADGTDGFSCPADDCCGDTAPADGSACMVRPVADCDATNFQACCYPPITNCGDSAAGFNVEAVAGAFTTDDTNVRLSVGNNGTIDEQVTHVSAQSFADGSATWSFTWTAPTAEEMTAALEAYEAEREAYNAEKEEEEPAMPEGTDFSIPFYVGATVGNGNFVDDINDLNGNKVYNVLYSSDEVPSFCALCEDGSMPAPNANGDIVCAVEGCSSCAVPDNDSSAKWPAIAGLLLVGLFIGRRRR